MQPSHRAVPVPVVVVGALLAAAVLVQLVLGDALGVRWAWIAALLAIGLFAILVVVDAGRAGEQDDDSGYDPAVVVLAALAIVAAVACLYLPLPWGGLGATAVLVALVGALRFNGGA